MQWAGIYCVLKILLCVCSLGTAQLTLQSCGSDDSDITCSFFFGKVDRAFRDENVLYTLRKLFFPVEGPSPDVFDVFMTLSIENVPNVTCRNDAFRDISIKNIPPASDLCNNLEITCTNANYSLGWQHQWSKSIIGYFVQKEDLNFLQDTNFVAFSAASFNSFDTSVFSRAGGHLREDEMDNSTNIAVAERDVVRFLLTIDSLPCKPDNDVLLAAWEDILPWIEIYAKNSEDLENVQYSKTERGFAFRETSTRDRGITLLLLTVIHILLNTVFALAVTYLLSKYHQGLKKVEGKRYTVVASMYWAVVLVCLAGSIVIIVGNAYLYYALVFFDKSATEARAYRFINDITVAAIVIVELIISFIVVHDPTFFIPHLIRRTLCCNQCCYCCGSQSRRYFLRRMILSIAMWIIMLFLQLVISSLLPVAVVCVINPVPSLAFLSIMVSMFFCLVVFVAYFLNAFEGNYIATHRLTKEERRRSSVSLEHFVKNPGIAGNWTRDKLQLLAQAFIFLVIFGIVTLVIIIYLHFVRAGADTNTVSGLFFSLVPSALLGGITWAAKKHLLGEDDEKDSEKEESTEEGYISVGGFSIATKKLRKASLKKLLKRRGNSSKNKTNRSSSTVLINMPEDHSESQTNICEDKETETEEVRLSMPEDEEEVHDDTKTDTCEKEREVFPTEPGEDENDGKSNSVELTVSPTKRRISFAEDGQDHDDTKTDTCEKEREVFPTEPGEDENDGKSNSVELTVSPTKRRISFAEDEQDTDGQD